MRSYIETSTARRTMTTDDHRIVHLPRVGIWERAGDLLGYRALCSCGWGGDLPLFPTHTQARQAGDVHLATTPT